MTGLPKQNVALNFVQGLDTKSDPKQLALGKFVTMENASLSVVGQVTKRAGYDLISTDIEGGGSLSTGMAIATFKRELLALDGLSLYSRSQELDSWIDKGAAERVAVDVEPLVNTSFNQSEVSYVVHSSGLAGYVYNDSSGEDLAKYGVLDTTTGTVLIDGEDLTGDVPGAFAGVVGAYIVFVYTDTSGGLPVFRYTAIDTTAPLSAPTTGTIPFTLTQNLVSVVSNNNRLYASVVDAGSNTIELAYLDASLVTSSVETLAGAPTTLHLFTDSSNNVWGVYQDANTNEVTYFIVDADLTSTVLAPTGAGVTALTSFMFGVYKSTTADIYYVSTDTGSPCRRVEVNAAGSVISDTFIALGITPHRSPFVYEGTSYIPAIYASDLQTTLFVLSEDGNVVAKALQGLAAESNLVFMRNTVTLVDGEYVLPVTKVDLLTTESGRAVTQTGVSLVTLTFSDPSASHSLQISNNLLMTGSFLSMYDGTSLVEQGFHLYPEDVSVAFTVQLTGATTNGSPIVTLAADPGHKVVRGQTITGTGIPADTIVSNVSGTTLTLTKNATATNGSVTLTFKGGGVTADGGSWAYYVVYEWTDAQGNRYQSAPSPAETSNIDASATTSHGFTGDTTDGSTAITNINPTAGLFVGQRINGSGIPVNATITAINGNTITISSAASATATGVSLNTNDIGGTIVAVPTLKLTNKDTTGSPVIISIYRTVRNGTSAYRITDLDNPLLNDTTVNTVYFADVQSDDSIVGNELLYTTGGVIENIPPPPTSFITTYKNRVILLPTHNNSSFWYSQATVVGQPVKFSDLFTWNIDQRGGDIVAGAEMDGKLILFKEEPFIFYIVGDGPTPTGAAPGGQAFSEAVRIETDSTCSEPRSVVSTPFGVIFKSRKGIQLLDRQMSVQYIGADVEEYNDETITSALLMPNEREVRLTTSEGTVLVFDYYLKQWFTYPSQAAVGAVIYDNAHTFLKANGEAYKQDPASFTDNGAFVQQKYSTGWLNFAGIQGFQRVYQMLILGEYHSAHTLTVNVYVDFDDTTPAQTATIEPEAGQTYEYDLRFTRQKCASMKIEIIENQDSSYGQGMSLSALTFEVGLKKGLTTLSRSRTF